MNNDENGYYIGDLSINYKRDFMDIENALNNGVCKYYN
jgi:hypothetical protein